MKAKKRKRTPKPRHTFLFVVVGLMLTAMGVYSLQQHYAFEATAAHSTGVVRDLERHVHRTGRRGGSIATVRPLIEFTPEGYEHPIKVHTSIEERDAYDVGQTVEVEYQPQTPERTMRIATGIPVLDTVVGAIGVVLLIRAIWKRYQWWADTRQIGMAGGSAVSQGASQVG